MAIFATDIILNQFRAWDILTWSIGQQCYKICMYMSYHKKDKALYAFYGIFLDSSP